MNLPDKDVGCHRTGFEKKCRQLVSDGTCNRWMTLEFNEPGKEPKALSDCVDNWQSSLLIQLIKKLEKGCDGIQTATESFRNEVMEMNGYPNGAPRQITK